MSKNSLTESLLIPAAIIIGCLIIGVFIYFIALKGFFKSDVSIGDTTIQGTELDLLTLSQGESSEDCDLELDDNRICTGDEVTGTIDDGKKHHCWIYGYVETDSDEGWYLLSEGDTDKYGNLEQSRTIDVEARIRFRAICDINDNGAPDTKDCITNYEDLIVEDCDSDDDSDDDGVDIPCDYLCQEEWGYDNGDDAIDGDCDIGVFKEDDNGNECCCWDDAPDNPVCQSEYPEPDSQDDCYSRPGCTDSLCVFVDGGLIGKNRCECVSNSCDGLCRYEGYDSGDCRDGLSKNPCGDDARFFAGDLHCGGFNDLQVCCCNI